jgi:hypothetical protein
MTRLFLYITFWSFIKVWQAFCWLAKLFYLLELWFLIAVGALQLALNHGAKKNLYPIWQLVADWASLKWGQARVCHGPVCVMTSLSVLSFGLPILIVFGIARGVLSGFGIIK